MRLEKDPFNIDLVEEMNLSDLQLTDFYNNLKDIKRKRREDGDRSKEEKITDSEV
jgi:hypothetical protein